MLSVGIIGNGPDALLPELSHYKDKVDIWIGADRGAYVLAANKIPIDYAVGDFDSITAAEKAAIIQHAISIEEFPSEKDETDLEIALNKAFMLHPERIYLFGVTGGRLDHELINIQLLYLIEDKGIHGYIVDKTNQLEMISPGSYTILRDEMYPYISFIPYTKTVEGIHLTGFYYPLTEADISWGSTLCISNKLLSKSGTFSFEKGILLLVKSCDAIQA
ncbi:thiamine diphosphokinase [Oceanobacillus massiliensis]|uniref:thiamine diphosphokinase n=1 Tax=Oceanobacillus massiliensis TaxID=1465765 RepID=UPI000289F2CF|nr:thiamine diphosphokinase [Oceanobacillus massiliensis]